MKNNLAIGITGGIGSGKTLVSRIFGILGIPVYDADSRAKYLLNQDTDLKKKVLELFGPKAYTNEKLNNKWIADHVFNDPKKLDELNRLVHPIVGEDFDKWRKKESQSSVVLKEAALLYESGSYRDLDKVIVVTAPEGLRIQRILKRDPHRSLEQVKDILKRQWPEEKKVKLADYRIHNDDKHLIIPQILRIHKQLLKLSGNVGIRKN